VTDEIRAAGAVLWRPAGAAGGPEVLLVHRPKYDDWSLPKGKLEPGEHVLLAAVREVAEETGLRVALGRRLPPVHYLVGGAPKRVDYWVATAEDTPGEFAPNREIDQVAWVPGAVPASRARLSGEAALTYAHDVETVVAALAGPPRTAPLILLRHAAAGGKPDWPGDDLLRPLDPQGEQEAWSLAALLRCFGICRVVSAPAERCLATVRPYVTLTGAALEVEPAFDVTGVDSDAAAPAAPCAAPTTPADLPGARAEKVAAALTAGDEPVIICAHRENLPILLAAACAELGAAPPAGAAQRKGEFLVLHRAAGRLAAAERYHPDGR